MIPDLNLLDNNNNTVADDDYDAQIHLEVLMTLKLCLYSHVKIEYCVWFLPKFKHIDWDCKRTHLFHLNIIGRMLCAIALKCMVLCNAMANRICSFVICPRCLSPQNLSVYNCFMHFGVKSSLQSQWAIERNCWKDVRTHENTNAKRFTSIRYGTGIGTRSVFNKLACLAISLRVSSDFSKEHATSFEKNTFLFLYSLEYCVFILNFTIFFISEFFQFIRNILRMPFLVWKKCHI